MESHVGLIAKIGAALVSLVGGAFGLGKYNSILVKRKELYNQNGSLIYLTAKKAEDNINDCRSAMAKEIEGVNKRLDKISNILIENNKRDMSNAEILGGIKQYMKDHS